MSGALKETPMIRQYLSIKEKYADAILFFRMGDFYEMFFEDAEIASRILEITLTSRNKNDQSPIPMCGVPVRAAQAYIARLISNGRKVAVCEQIEDPAAAKGIVKREVVRLITPGMIVENELLDSKSNNYILSIGKFKESYGLAWIDISTGTFQLAELDADASPSDEILRIAPSEILASESMRDDQALKVVLQEPPHLPYTFIESKYYDYQDARERLTGQFKTVSLEGFGCESMRAGVGAAGALLYHIRDTQKQDVDHITSIETCRFSRFMLVDDLSVRNLELIRNLHTGSRKGSLLGTLDQTITAMGSRLMKRWIRYPLKDAESIRTRLNAVKEAGENIQKTREIRTLLKSVSDLERLTSRIAMSYANARELLALKRSLESAPEIVQRISSFHSPLYVFDLDSGPFTEIAEIIESAISEDAPQTINEGGIIREGYNPELDALIRISRDGKGELLKLEQKERRATGINTLKVRYNKVFGYYIEAPKSQSHKIPEHYIRKQTLVNSERYMTEELKRFEETVMNAQEKRVSLEFDIFTEVRHTIVQRSGILRKLADFIASVDCLLNLAEIAQLNGYTCPEIVTDGSLFIEDGRHPVVEKMITGERFVPNTIRLDGEENRILIITGPNMAGKSTILRQTAILAIMAHMGSFVPAANAKISIIDRIFTRVGALDNLSQGQSTFMVEMQETANILHNATPQSLVVMDEIGRGTSTYDGISIAWAVVEHLHDLKGKGVKTLFATHYHELTELSERLTGVQNFNIAIKEYKDEIIFLRKLVEGGTNKSYGVQVARLAGIPENVVNRAKKVLTDVEAEKSIPPGQSQNTINEPDKGYIQLDLFENPAQVIVDEIQNLDLTIMTPLEAMNRLNEMKKKISEFNLN